LPLAYSRPDDDAALFLVLQRVKLGARSTKPEMLHRVRIGRRLVRFAVTLKSKEASIVPRRN
jgi:hypothetical protein